MQFSFPPLSTPSLFFEVLPHICLNSKFKKIEQNSQITVPKALLELETFLPKKSRFEEITSPLKKKVQLPKDLSKRIEINSRKIELVKNQTDLFFQHLGLLMDSQKILEEKRKNLQERVNQLSFADSFKEIQRMQKEIQSRNIQFECISSVMTHLMEDLKSLMEERNELLEEMHKAKMGLLPLKNQVSVLDIQEL